MSEFDKIKLGWQLLIDGRSDEDVEHLTGISLLNIIALRGAAAAAPSDVRGMAVQFSAPAEDI